MIICIFYSDRLINPKLRLLCSPSFFTREKLRPRINNSDNSDNRVQMQTWRKNSTSFFPFHTYLKKCWNDVKILENDWIQIRNPGFAMGLINYSWRGSNQIRFYLEHPDQQPWTGKVLINHSCRDPVLSRTPGSATLGPFHMIVPKG